LFKGRPSQRSDHGLEGSVLEQIEHALSHNTEVSQHLVTFLAFTPHLRHVLGLFEHQVEETLDLECRCAQLDILINNRFDGVERQCLKLTLQLFLVALRLCVD